MVTEVGSAPDERHHPAAGLAVKNEDDRGMAGTLSEFTPAVDRGKKLFETVEEGLSHLISWRLLRAGKLEKVADHDRRHKQRHRAVDGGP
jgi:hypothetical protein